MNEELIRRVSTPLYNAKGWMKLLGIMSIIMGILVALSIVGIIVAWLPIWTGVLLLQSANAIEQAFNTGGEQAMVLALQKLRTYFIIFGVIMLLQIIMMVGGLSLGVLGVLLGYADMYNY